MKPVEHSTGFFALHQNMRESRTQTFTFTLRL
ncbi:hypothetical protein J2W90_003302 [Bacillus pumilus]|nr:hypothetical protein [Bacillus pumilus]